MFQINKPRLRTCCLWVFVCIGRILSAQSAGYLLNEPFDISPGFRDFTNTYFLADHLTRFDPATNSGEINWKRARYNTRHAFDNTMAGLQTIPQNEFPAVEYAADMTLPLSIQFVSPRTLRIRATSGPQFRKNETSMMLAREPASDPSWQYEKVDGGHRYKSVFGSVTVMENPWRIEFRDAGGRLLTQTKHQADGRTSFTPTLPFSFVRRASDYSRSMAAVFSLMPDEKIFGCGESFTKLNKNGQKVVLFTDDANGVETGEMYKPVPFFLSSRGYGMFMHTSSPITCDFGASFGAHNALLIGDDELDLFVFLGDPKAVLDEYTDLTGKASMPPLWSFGLWMSRITYFSEEDGRRVARQLRENRIPADVIHFDTGWFETDWRCDYQFSPSRFKDPAGMIRDLKTQGFRTCLWQLPYFVPKNTLFPEIIDKGLAVKDGKGNIPYEDAVLDFSNPKTVDWYQEKIAGLLKQGVSVIKVDFGEAAPVNGVYANGRTGFYEHNLYPLRYQTAVADITKKITGETIIWARSAWAGSQRFPLHWGGDTETTDMGMEAQLRGGLSLGLSGFSFWSHDIGGFTTRTPEELYRRWLPFGMLSSHTRCHGQPPKEPWEFGPAFNDYFRKVDELRYRLMPYLYAQAKQSSEQGLPVLRALFLEFPGDPGAWQIDNEYLLGSDILVAPIFESGTKSRDVYLPGGQWIDYQTNKVYEAGWHHIAAGELEVVMLVREGTVLPHIALAQSTADMDWSKLELVVFAANSTSARGKICLPSDQKLVELSLIKKGKSFALNQDPLGGQVKWTTVLRPTGK
ncbi:MAG: alpha-xylosidase [Lewinellaceae bacterium]|nr:alpha-xylosidase [Lewinellaceae bacterium]